VNPFGNPQKLLKQLQQEQERVQREIAALEIEATAGGGMVRVTMNGEKLVTSLKIDPEVVSKDDVGMLEDLILAALNEATAKVDQSVREKLGGLADRFKIPGLS
jgi:nucleoid-associated protein EbfC